MKIYKHSVNPAMEKENFIQSRVPDVTELARLLKKAQGERRTMAEFAKECEISASTFSRILNGKISQPLAFETLEKIWRNADPEAKLIFAELISANGMVSKSFVERKKKRYPGTFESDEERFSAEREIKNILMEELLDRGLSVERQKRIHVDENVPASISGAGRSGMILVVAGYEPRYWKIKVLTHVGIRRGFYGDEPIPAVDHECEADWMFHNEAEVFLKDAWEPQRTEKVKISYVFTDIETLEEFSKHVDYALLNGWFSLILVDRENRKVVYEKHLTRKDGRTMESLFSLPIQVDSDEWRNDMFWSVEDVF